MLFEGIQSEDLRIRRGAGDKKKYHHLLRPKKHSKLSSRDKYRIRKDHQVLTDHGVSYHHALYNDLTFELTLGKTKHLVKGSDLDKLVYKLKNMQLEYADTEQNSGRPDRWQRVLLQRCDQGKGGHLQEGLRYEDKHQSQPP